MSGVDSLTALVEWFLPRELREAEPDTLRRARLCVAFNLTVPLSAPAFAVILWRLDQPLIAAIIAGVTACAPLPLVLLRRTGSLALVANLISAITLVVIGGCTWLEGGLDGPGALWFPLVPILAILIGGRRAGAAWTGAVVATLVAFYVLERLGLRAAFALDAGQLALLRLGLSVSAIITFAVLAALFESLKVAALRSLETANRALGQARDQAEAAARAKSDFLATMSHEIRTPIHGIFGMTELALDTADEGERRDFLHRARACAETLLGVINDILDFSRMEAGKIALERVEFDPRAVVEGVLDTLSTLAAQKGLELLGCVDERVPARLLGDPGRLRQVLVNLGGNAVKFTEHGEVVIHLEPATPEGAAPEAFVLHGAVRDTGIGIAHDKQAAIFEAFTQAEEWTTRRYGGAGLGLAISRRLVGLMGGTLSLESEPSRGSTFRFAVRLPAAAPPPEPARLDPPGLRVLVVDENAASRRHLLHTIRAFGGVPLAAADRAEHGRGGAVDAVVVSLPAGAAAPPDTVPRLRALSGAPAAPIVALVSGRCSATRARHPGLSAVLAKPIKSGALLAALAAVARRSRRPAIDTRPGSRLPSTA